MMTSLKVEGLICSFQRRTNLLIYLFSPYPFDFPEQMDKMYSSRNDQGLLIRRGIGF